MSAPPTSFFGGGFFGGEFFSAPKAAGGTTGGNLDFYRPRYAGHTEEDRQALRRAREALEPVPEPVKAVIDSVVADRAGALELMQALSDARLEYKAAYLEHLELQAREAFLAAQADEELGVVLCITALVLQ